jgi:hypothetical protein
MPRRIINHRATPVVLVVGNLIYAVGIITYRMFVDRYAGVIAAPIILAVFALAYYLSCRGDKCNDPDLLKSENEKLREELRAYRKQGLK